MNRGGLHRRNLWAVAERFPMVAHGVGASLGSDRPVDRTFLRQLRETVRSAHALWASDHISYTTAGGISMNELIPLPFTEEAVRRVAKNVVRVRDAVDVPYLVENASYYAIVDDHEMDEATFIRAVCDEADCGLLLDVNNVYVNACNHGYDAEAMIARLPLERVVQVHLAGHDDSGEILVDTHGAPVPPPVWRLFERVLPLLPPCSVMIEWDNEIPAWERLVQEAARARRIVDRTGFATPRKPARSA